MESKVFTLPQVQELFKNYVIASIVTDKGDEKANAVWAKYRPDNRTGIPHYAIIDHDGEVLRRSGATLKDPSQFVSFLKGETVIESAPTVVEPEPAKPAPSAGDTLPALPSQAPDELDEIFDFEARFTSGEVKPGGEVTLELRFRLKQGDSGKYRLYHPDSPHSFIDGKSYSLFLVRVTDLGGVESAGKWEFPEPKIVPVGDPENFFEDDEWKYFDDFVVVRKFILPEDAQEGAKFTLKGSLAGQYCNDSTCIWFMDESKTPFTWQATLTATSDGAEKALVPPSKGGKESRGREHNPVDRATSTKPVEPPTAGGLTSAIEESGGLFWFLLGVFLLGMVTLLTPCVLPVLPLTIGFFVKQAEQGRSPIAAALIYCTCIVAVFTAFGLITSLALGEQGAQIVSTNPWVNLAIAILFVALALSFFGMFELRMPAFLSSWLSRKQMSAQKEGRGYMTALLSGGSFAVISFSCTGPIAAVILAGAAGGGGGDENLARWVPTLAMLVFASGLALPIFVMGMFPSLLKKLPKSGSWMNALKVTFAFIEIAIAIRYFSWAEIGFSGEVVPHWFNRDLVDAVWIACSVGAGLYLLGLFRMPHDHEKTEQVGVVRTLIAISFFAFALYLLPGLVTGKPMGLLDGFMPPRAEMHEGWHQDLDDALAEAQITGKPVFVDFTGVVCSNCRWVETNIMPTPEVHELLEKDFILVQQWTDKDDDPKAKQYYAKYGQGGKGVPMYVVLHPDGTMVEKLVPPQFINSLTPEDFAEFLKRGRAKVTGQ